MRTLSLAVRSFVFTSLLVAASVTVASPTSPVEGAEYKTLGNPLPVSTTGKKIEVIEFFMYHCPACNVLEPQLLEWVKKQGSKIVFIRIHLPHRGEDDPEAHLFLTLQALQLEGKLHARILRSWHVDHKQLLTDQDNIDWAVANGIDKTKFSETYTSFSVVTKLRGLLRVAENYRVDSTPTLVIDGRYLTGPGMVQETNQALAPNELDKSLLQVADVLVDKARAAK